MRTLRESAWPAVAALIAALGLVTAVGCKPKGPGFAIKSGDTVQFLRAARGHEWVLGKDGKQARIRLVGIYTFPVWPHEKSDITNYAQGAVTWVDSNFKGKEVTVTLELERTDSRGRYLGFVAVDGVDVAQKMIEMGHATLYTEFPFSREEAYRAAEETPRKANTGIWGGEHARKRVTGLRQTWAAVRAREHGDKVIDPLVVDSE